jgi:phosphoribosylformylglycinamidine synthase
MRTDALLFGESQSRMLVSVRRKSVSQLRELARREDVPCAALGEVRGHSLVIEGLVELSIEPARERWRRALERRVGG